MGCCGANCRDDFPPWETVYCTSRPDSTTVSPTASTTRCGWWCAMPPGVTHGQRRDRGRPVGQGCVHRRLRHSRGYDAGKKVNGRKRHIVVDTLGLLIVVRDCGQPAGPRRRAPAPLDRARMAMPSIALVWADGGYAGQAGCLGRPVPPDRARDWRRKPEGQRTFEVLPRRWVVERTLSWLVRWRRLDRDYERLPTHSEAMVKWAMIGLMARRLAPPPGRRPCNRPMPRKPLSKHVPATGRCATTPKSKWQEPNDPPPPAAN